NITTIAGNGNQGFNADGNMAQNFTLAFPRAVVIDGSGNVIVADSGNNRVRIIRGIDPNTNRIDTIAGNGDFIFNGDNVPATSSALSTPSGVAIDNNGNLFIAGTNNNRIRHVDMRTGIITTVA